LLRRSIAYYFTMSQRHITIQRLVNLKGPNIWTYRPVLEAWIDFGELIKLSPQRLDETYARLREALPTLLSPGAGIEASKGFAKLFENGQWTPATVEHVTLALQQLAGLPGGFGETRATDTSGLFKVVVRAWHEIVTHKALESSIALICGAVDGSVPPVGPFVDTLHTLRIKHCLGPSTACIVDAADDRDIPAIRLSAGNLLQLGYGINQRRIWTAETDNTGAIAETISRDKDLTKSLLQSCGVPVPVGQAVDSAAQAWEVAQELGLPVVVKPSDGNHGRGVFTNLSTQAEILAAYPLAEQEGSGVLVERFIAGFEHRLLIVGGKLIAAARGQYACVTGDGKSGIRTLIESQLNADPLRGREEDLPLNYIKLDSVVELEIARQGLSWESIPALGQTVVIQRNGNVAIDCTEEVHPDIASTACTAARIVGLDIAGIDLVVQDISKPLIEQQGAIVEVNAGPGLLMHLKPAVGQARQVGRDIVGYTFPPGDMARVPVVGITGTYGKSMVGKILYHLLCLHGWNTGLSTTEGLFVQRRKLHAGNSANHENARRVLLNREVQAVVLENGAKQILSEGLTYERCEVGIITNIDWDQDLSEFNIHSPLERSDVYRTQMDVVLPSGMAVLLADDPKLLALAQYCDGQVTLFSKSAATPTLVEHVAAGHRGVFIDHGQLVMAEGARRYNLCNVSAIGCTEQARNHQQICNVLAAAAAAWALGVSLELIEAGLLSFDPNTALPS
jgi:cyanophycin synthetase